MSEAILRATGISKAYISGPRRVEVLDRLDLEVGVGEAVAIVGDSGVGKSTLMHVLGGLDPPDSGSVEFRWTPIYGGASGELARYRNASVGFVFQFHHLLPEFTAFENVLMPFLVGRAEPDLARIDALFERLGLTARRTHFPSQLSGGEQQRVAIVRAVAARPAVVLADEPTGNLDPGTGDRVFATLRALQSDERFALVLATHSGRLARGCDRMLRLDGGRLRSLDDVEAREYFGFGP